jgi:peptidoglycan/xylan/chitin deacetylase (PgdA/CDA1 family)
MLTGSVLLKRAMRNTAVLMTGAAIRCLGSKCGKRVIALHEVKDPSRFREKVQWLRQYCEIVSLEELFWRPIGRKTMVAITFDDGYKCWHEQAAPILEELSIPAVFFLCSGFVGLEGERARQFCRERLRRQQQLSPLTRRQVHDLAGNALFEIGSHTRNHVDLGQRWDAATLEHEIEGDRQRLEEWTGKPVRWFAYPFGGLANVSSDARGYLRHLSLKSAFTYIPQFLDPDGDRLLIGRDGLDVMGSTRLWEAWLGGAYDGLYTMKERVRCAAGQISSWKQDTYGKGSRR